MFTKSLLLPAAIFSMSISAQLSGDGSLLESRTLRSQGGYSLRTTLCPNTMDQCGGQTQCCPTSLTCIITANDNVDNTCCPGTLDCRAALDANPYCADDTWSLWDQSLGGIVLHQYFCCGVGLVGSMSGTCVDPDTISASNQMALQLAPGGQPLNISTAAASTSTATTVVVVSPTAITVTSTSSASAVVDSTTVTPTVSAKTLTTSSASQQSMTSTPATGLATASRYSSGTSLASPSATKVSGAGANGVAGVVLFVQFVLGTWAGLV